MGQDQVQERGFEGSRAGLMSKLEASEAASYWMKWKTSEMETNLFGSRVRQFERNLKPDLPRSHTSIDSPNPVPLSGSSTAREGHPRLVVRNEALPGPSTSNSLELPSSMAIGCVPPLADPDCSVARRARTVSTDGSHSLVSLRLTLRMLVPFPDPFSFLIQLYPPRRIQAEVQG